jgi:hypothetical protein
MSRLFTCGWETGTYAESGGSGAGGSPVTSPVRSGNFAGQFNAQALHAVVPNTLTVTARNYYVKAWIRFPAAPSAAMPIIWSGDGVSTGVTVRANTDRTLSLVRGSTVAATSAALAVDTWHLVRFRFKHVSGTNDEGELIVNGIAIGSFTATANHDAAPQVVIGRFATGTYTIYMDDVAVNDDQGANENSWPDDNGVVVLLKPTADSAVGGSWLAGGSNSTGLWDALNNTPPVGVAFTSATPTSQIIDAANDGASYDATLETYASRLTGTIKLIKVAAFTGPGGAVQQFGLTGVSNPVIAELAPATPTASAVGTFPSSWGPMKGNVYYGDIAAGNRGTAPVVRIRKVTSTTDRSHCCLLGLMVEYVPSVTYDDTCTGRIALSGSVAVPTFRSVSNVAYAQRTNTQISVPAGVQNGDLLLWFQLTGFTEAPDPTPPAGWSVIPGWASPTDTSDSSFNVETRGWYRFASSEPANYTATHVTCSSQAVMVAYSGVDPSTPFDVSAMIASGNGPTATVPGLTPVTDGAMIVWFNHDWGATSLNLVPPAGSTPTFTERLEVNPLVYVADGRLATAGATGNKSHAVNNPSGGTVEGWGAALVALRSASALVLSPGVTYTDAPSGTIALAGTRTESRSCADARTGALALSGTKIEGKAVSDSPSGAIGLTGSRVEASVRSDAPTGTLRLAGTVTESWTHTVGFIDVATGAISINGTSIDSWTHENVSSDSPIGTINLTGSSTDSWQHSAAVSGRINLTGTRTESVHYEVFPVGLLVLRGSVVDDWFISIYYDDASTGRIGLNGTCVDSTGSFPGDLGTGLPFADSWRWPAEASSWRWTADSRTGQVVEPQTGKVL